VTTLTPSISAQTTNDSLHQGRKCKCETETREANLGQL
jgi:hypothetical protein